MIEQDYSKILSPDEYLCFNIARQLKYKGSLEFTDKHDYTHLIAVMENIQKLIEDYKEIKFYWVERYGSIYEAKKQMSLCAFAHDLMRGYKSDIPHGEHFFKLWNEGKTPPLFQELSFECVQAIKRHSFDLPENPTPEDIFLKTADSLDLERFNIKINPELLPLKEAQERIRDLQEFKFIDFLSDIPIEQINETFFIFDFKIQKGNIRLFFKKQKKKYHFFSPPSNKIKLLRKNYIYQQYELFTEENLINASKKEYPNHNQDKCPYFQKQLKDLRKSRSNITFQQFFFDDLWFLYQLKKYIPKNLFAELFINSYISNQYPLLSMGIKEMQESFEYCKNEIMLLMNPIDKKFYRRCPKKLKVYRGFSLIGMGNIILDLVYGMSWNLDIHSAKDYSYQRNKYGIFGTIVLEGTIDKKDIYFVRKTFVANDMEIIINPFKIKELKVVEQKQGTDKQDIPFDLEYYKKRIKNISLSS